MATSSQITLFLKKLKTNSQSTSRTQSYLAGLSQLLSSIHFLFLRWIICDWLVGQENFNAGLWKVSKNITEICDGREVLIPSRGTDVRDSEEALVRNSPVRHTGCCQRQAQPLSDRKIHTSDSITSSKRTWHKTDNYISLPLPVLPLDILKV